MTFRSSELINYNGVCRVALGFARVKDKHICIFCVGSLMLQSRVTGSKVIGGLMGDPGSGGIILNVTFTHFLINNVMFICHTCIKQGERQNYMMLNIAFNNVLMWQEPCLLYFSSLIHILLIQSLCDGSLNSFQVNTSSFISLDW